MIPGPVSIADDVLAALGEPVIAHYGSEWTDLYVRVTSGLRRILRTAGQVHLLFGPGSAAIEMCIASVVSPGEGILIPANGFFGDRMIEIARAHGLQVVTVPTARREAVSVEAVRRALDGRPELRAVAMVHHETSLGVVNPVREVAALARDRGALMIVDAVSSAGGIDLDVDGWGIDLCATVANKCLGGPIGVAPVVAGERAIDALKEGRPRSAGWYLDLATWSRYSEDWKTWHPHPTTMPTSVVVALDVAVQQFLDEGLEARLLKQLGARDRVRQGLSAAGFEMLVPDEVASPVTTAALGPAGMDVTRYMAWLLERGIRIAGGMGEFAGKAIRVGHMGRAMQSDAIERFLELTASYVGVATVPR